MSLDGSLDTDRLLALFFLAWRGFAAEPDAILERNGLGRVHHRVLYIVARLPGVRIGTLAGALGISRQALHRPLSELVDRRLIESRVAKESARERALSLTRRGRQLELSASSAQRQQLDRAFERAGPAARRGWIEVMASLASVVDPALLRMLERGPQRDASSMKAGASDDGD